MNNKGEFDVKGFHIMHLNIRSLFCRNKYDMFKQQMIDSGLDVICLSETWLKRGMHSNYINIPGYNITRVDRGWSENGTLKKGGGLCMYINKSINFSDYEISNFNKS